MKRKSDWGRQGIRQGLKRMAIVFPTTRPSHVARLQSLADAGHYNVFGIETVCPSHQSSWGGREHLGWSRYTLFREDASEKCTGAATWLRLKMKLNCISPDIIAVAGWSHPSALAGMSWAHNRRTPIVLMSESTAHDDKRIILKETAKKMIVGGASSALAGGTEQKKYLQMLGFRDERIYVGYNVVDNFHFQSGAQRARKNPDDFRRKYHLPQQYFLMSNRFVEKKNLYRSLTAYSKYHRLAGETAWGLVLIGDGPLSRNIKFQIERLGLSNFVQMPGHQSYEDLPYYYGLAGAFIHSSTVEQWGMVVNEALASGLPAIVSSHCGCAPDLIKNGYNGFTFDPFQPDQLAYYMHKIATCAQMRESFGKASHKIIQNWSLKVFAENMTNAADKAFISGARRPSFGVQALLWCLCRRAMADWSFNN